MITGHHRVARGERGIVQNDFYFFFSKLIRFSKLFAFLDADRT